MQWIDYDIFWAWGTIALITLIAAGYCVIAFNWYFQMRMRSHAQSNAALRKLVGICISCIVCGSSLYLMEMPWLMWRLYDAILVVVAIRTWTFVIRVRGLSLLNEKLAQIDEMDRTARKYRQIAELLPHMVWTANVDGQIDFSNVRWHEYVGDNRSWLDAVHPQQQQEARLQWLAAVEARQAMQIEVRLAGTSGYRTFSVKATPIVQGNAIKWLGACADVEDQKLLAAEKELQARQKAFFLNALSHDLRAPLHNVVLNAHLLKMTARDEADIQSVNMIMENAVAAGDLVTRLLDFAKVGARDDNHVESVSMSAVVQQVVRRFMPIAEAKALYLRTSGDADALVATDRQKIVRILSNLVDNAIKYTTRGGVTIALAADVDQVSLQISDTGIGIPSANVPYLFDEFYQVNNYERDRSKGFGMGLAICRCLARHLGGDVRLAHSSNEGSCFELVIKILGADRRGRPVGQDCDRAPAEPTGLCGV
jgi:signal transduction histidine kinase